MNSFSEAVKLAIEKGGYGMEKYGSDTHEWINTYVNRPEATEDSELSWENVKARDFIQNRIDEANNTDTLLDPLFWIALGKSLGWDKGDYLTADEWRGVNVWQHYAMRYFATKLSGGNEEQFFNELLKGK